MRVLLLFFLMGVSMLDAAAARDPATTFEAFYRRAYPVQATPPARFVADADARGGMQALVDAAPQRGLGALCRMAQQRFVYDPALPGARGWRAAAARELVWLTRGAGCKRAAAEVLMLQPVADVDLIALLEQAPALLARARLLLAGNSGCAPMRSFAFTLAGAGVGAPQGRAEVMYELRFQSDREGVATVWVRKRGAELTAWDVRCATQLTE